MAAWVPESHGTRGLGSFLRLCLEIPEVSPGPVQQQGSGLFPGTCFIFLFTRARLLQQPRLWASPCCQQLPLVHQVTAFAGGASPGPRAGGAERPGGKASRCLDMVAPAHD